jgi:UDP-N-acetylglucosamine diphosphorylase/glucosamine-1-phosphate N-acetyltransferase
MTVLLFEDPRVTQLYPISVGKLAFTISCGGYHLLEQVQSLGCPIAALVRPHLRMLLTVDFPAVRTSPTHSGQGILLLNARVVPSLAVRRELARLLAIRTSGIVRKGDDIIAVRLTGEIPLPPEGLDIGALLRLIDEMQLPAIEAQLPLIEYPHDIVRHHMLSFGENLEERIRIGNFQQQKDGIFLAEGATLGEYLVTDTSKGPIVIEAGGSIGPFSLLRGPVHLGRGARVLEHAAIKDNVSLGHTTKIGGEVEASIVEPYTNKQHHGFLGHSYLGSWINLGAGTCNSDLKNTYGEVKMEYRHAKVPTGMQFIGAMMGDYAKSAINTGIFTGKTIGVCSMIYGFVTTNVPSFVNYARLFGQVTSTPVEVMVATQARMFARRNVLQRPCDIQLLHDMYDLTRHERELGSVPPEPLSL